MKSWTKAKLDHELGLDGGRAPVHTVFVRLEDQLPIGQPEPTFHFLTDGHDLIGFDGVGQPDGDLVSFGSDVDHSTVDNVSAIAKSFADQTHHDLQPDHV